MRPHVRIALAATVAAAVLTAAFPAAAQTPQAVLSVGSGSGYPGQSGINVTVSLASQGGAQVAAVNFDLTYDSSRVTVPPGLCNGLAIAIGLAAQSAGKSIGCSQLGANSVRVIVFGLDQRTIGDGSLAVITFNILGGAAPGAFALSLSNVVATDPGTPVATPAPIPVTTINGEFTVLPPPPTSTATATTVPPSPTVTGTRTPTGTSTRTPTASTTPVGPTPTRTTTSTPTRTPTRTPYIAPTSTPTGPTPTTGPTLTRTATTAPTLTRTATQTTTATLPPTLTQLPTATHTAPAPVETTAAPPLDTPTPEGMYPPGLETAVAATATALGQLDQAVIATATAMAGGNPVATSVPSAGPQSRVPFGGVILLLGVIAFGALALGGLLALYLWRRQSAPTEQPDAGDPFS